MSCDANTLGGARRLTDVVGGACGSAGLDPQLAAVVHGEFEQEVVFADGSQDERLDGVAGGHDGAGCRPLERALSSRHADRRARRSASRTVLGAMVPCLAVGAQLLLGQFEVAVDTRGAGIPRPRPGAG